MIAWRVRLGNWKHLIKQVKRASFETLTLDSKVPHVMAMSLAWTYQPYIDGGVVRDLVSELDKAVAAPAEAADTPEIMGLHRPHADIGGVKKKKKKKKKSQAEAAANGSGGGPEEAGGSDCDSQG